MAYTFHFNALPPHLRERLTQCFSGNQLPAPILEDKLGKTGFLIGMGMLSMTGFCGFLFFVMVDYGHLYSGVQGWGFVFAYATTLFMCAYGIVKGIWRMLLMRAMPFAPGRYLFPLDFVDATKPVLVVHPMSTLQDFQCVHNYTNGAYTGSGLNFYFPGGGHEVFTVHSREQAEQMLGQMDEQRTRFLQALEAQEMEVVAALDPFLDVRLDDSWASFSQDAVEEPEGAEYVASDIPYPLLWPSIVAFIVAMMFATPIWGIRNFMSDGAMFERAKHSKYNKVSSLKRYLRKGKRFRKEVREVHLPAAAFERAKKKKSVTDMRYFLLDHPHSAHEKEAKQFISTLYAAALTKFERQSNKENVQLKPFMTKLLKYLETHDAPPVDVRFRPPSSATLKIIYDLMAKNFGPKSKLGKKNPVYKRRLESPAIHFTAKASTLREKKITKILQNGFASVFPADIMHLSEGPRLPEQKPKETDSFSTSAEAKIRFPRPTIVVDYSISLSGQVYTLDKDPSRVFTGILVFFNVTIHIPEDDKPLTIKFKVEPPKTFKVGADRYGLHAGGTSTSSVYNVMAVRAFEQLVNQMRDQFFDKTSAAYKTFKARAPKPKYRH